MSADFNPLAYGAPVHAFWAEDPELMALADGAVVASWPNRGSNGVPASQAALVARPVFRVTSVSGRPGVDFDGTDDSLVVADGSTPVLSQPGTWVVVFEADVVSGGVANRSIVSTDTNSATNRWLVRIDTGGELDLYAGTVVNTGAILSASTTYVVVATFDGINSYVWLNGELVMTGSNPGAGSSDGVSFAHGGNFDGRIHFAGQYAVDAGGEAWFDEFHTGLLYHYGVLPDQRAAGISRARFSFIDSFDRADETLDTSIYWSAASSGYAIVGNQLEFPSAAGIHFAECLVTLADDQYCQAEYITNGGLPDVICRWGGVNESNMYMFRYNGEWQLYRRTNSWSKIDSAASPAPAPGQVVRIEAQGTTIRGLVDGVEVCSATDSVLTSGSAGFRASGAGSAQVGNFECGDL